MPARIYPAELSRQERKNLSNAAVRERIGEEAWQARRREYVRRYKEKHPDRVLAGDRRRSWMKKFGLTPEDYQEWLDFQEGVCALCKSPPGDKFLAVDHDHKTGDVRGLLCGPCNMALGVLEHNLQEVMSYVA